MRLMEMSMEEKILYIDVEQLYRRYGGVPGFCITNDLGKAQEPVCTGKVILSMTVTEKQEKAYQILAEEYDVRFIFDDAIPKLEFYPIPQLGIFAIDSLGGCFGSTNVVVDISEENAPIYYVNNELQYYYLAANLLAFIQLVVFQPEWKKGIVKDGYLAVDPSLEGKVYLLNALNLNRDNVALNADKEIKNTIIIYQSFEEAKKVMTFYDIKEVGAREYEDCP